MFKIYNSMYTTNSLIYSKKLSQRISALISIPIDLCFNCNLNLHVFDFHWSKYMFLITPSLLNNTERALIIKLTIIITILYFAQDIIRQNLLLFSLYL